MHSQKLPTQKKVIELKDKIISTYIKSGSKKEINLSAHVRKTVLQNEKEAKTIKDIEKLFKAAKQAIYKETKSDNFVRFLRTDECLKLIGKYYMYDKDVMVLSDAVSMNFTYDDFRDPFFNSRDIAMSRLLNKDSLEWKLKYTSGKSAKLFVSDRNYYPNVAHLSSFRFVKVETLLPFSFKKAVYNLFPLKLGYFGADPATSNMNTHTYYKQGEIQKTFKRAGSGNEMSCVLFNSLYEVNSTTHMMQVLAAAASWDADNGILTLILKPYHDEKLLGKDFPFDYSKKIEYEFEVPGKVGQKKKYKCFVGAGCAFLSLSPVNENTTSFTSTYVYPLGQMDISKYGKYLVQRAGETAARVMKKTLATKLSDLDEEKDYTVKLLKDIKFEELYEAYKLKQQKDDLGSEYEFNDETSDDTLTEIDDE